VVVLSDEKNLKKWLRFLKFVPIRDEEIEELVESHVRKMMRLDSAKLTKLGLIISIYISFFHINSSHSIPFLKNISDTDLKFKVIED
jgi:hypothetical protein